MGFIWFALRAGGTKGAHDPFWSTKTLASFRTFQKTLKDEDQDGE